MSRGVGAVPSCELSSAPEPRYRLSSTYRAGERLGCIVSSALARVCRSLESSASGSALLRAAGWLKEAIRGAASGSFLVRTFWPLARMALASYGSPLTVDTVLGLALAVACVAPTEAVFLAGAGAFALCLWDGVKRSGDGGPIWHLPGFGMVSAILAVFLFLVGATFSSVLPSKSLSNLVIWCFYLMFFFVAADRSQRGRLENVVWPFLTGATLTGLVGIYQKFSGWRPPKVWVDPSFQDEIIRVVGTFTNPVFFAEMLGLSLPLVIALLFSKEDWRDRLVLFGFAAVQGAGLILSSSRGAWLGFALSFCIMAVLYDWRLLPRGLALGLVGLFLAPQILIKRLLSAFSLTDSSNAYRIFIWRGSLAMLKANLLRGVGLGAESYSKVYPEYMIVQTPAPHAHSTFLQFLIEVGLLGFLAMASFFIIWLIDVLKVSLARSGKRGARPTEIVLLAGAVGAVGGNLLEGLVDYTWYSPRVTSVFWAIVGIAAGIATSKIREAQHGGRAK